MTETSPPLNGNTPSGNVSTGNVSTVKLTPDDLDILVFCEQFWNLHGHLPSVDRAVELGLDAKVYHNTLLKEAFQGALSERGIVLRSVNGSMGLNGFKARTLTAEQLAAANTLLDLTDTRSQKKKLQDLSISTTKYQSWLKDPVFKQYLMERAENLLGDNGHEANLALLDSVRSGNIQAIAYFNEMTGRFIPESKRSISRNNVDMQSIVRSVIEIVQQEVPDLETQQRIGERLIQLIQANQLAAALVANSSSENPKELEAAPANGTVVVTHPLEGGFSL